MRLLIGAGLTVLMLAGCGGPSSMTPYQSLGLTGGTMVEPGADGTVLIRAVGNGYTPIAAMDDYVMLRAAEYTLEQGARCFEVVSRASQMNEISMASQYGAMDFDKPAGRVRIRVTPDRVECGEGDAAAVIERLRPRVQNRSVYFQN